MNYWVHLFQHLNKAIPFFRQAASSRKGKTTGDGKYGKAGSSGSIKSKQQRTIPITQKAEVVCKSVVVDVFPIAFYKG